jgi:hypothetical protein
LADAVESDDEAAEAAARAQVKTLRMELDDLPADVITYQERTWSSETYGEMFARLDTAGRRELLAALVAVTVGRATERTATGHYDNSADALARRVRVVFDDALTDAAVDALEQTEATNPA